MAINEDKLLIDRRTLALLKQYIPQKDALENMANFFSALSDGTRIKIISALSISEMCVNDLSSVLRLNQTTVSHQLKNLKSVGVVKVKRQGKVSFYSIKDRSILDAMSAAASFM